MTLPLLIIIIPILSFIGGFCFGKASGIKKGLYAIGNIDKAKNKYKRENELIATIDKFLTVKTKQQS